MTTSTMVFSCFTRGARTVQSPRKNGSRVSLMIALVGLFAGQLIACAKNEPTIAGSFGTGGSGTGADASDDAGQDEALVSWDSSIVFDEDTLWRFDLTASDSDVAWLDANIKLEQSIPATLTANGHLIGQVGFRYKGSYGTLYNCLDANGNPICKKIGRKIVFDEYDPTKRFYGLKKLNFNSSVWDDSLMRERLGYGMFREMNVYASRAGHALLYLNGDYLGVFSMVEEVDGRFTDNRFQGDGNGNLYKECWPTSTDPAYYTACLQTNKATPEVTGMVSFGTAVSNATDSTLPGIIAQYNDIDYLARYLAVDRGIAANDGIMAFWDVSGWVGNHNYYWYQDEKEDRFWLIPWDMYSTYNALTPLDWVPAWDQPPGDCSTQYTSWDVGKYYRAPGCDPFIHGLSLLDRSRYLTAVQQLLDGPFQLDSVNEKLDRWSAQIADSVATDTHGPGSQGFQNNVAYLKSNVALLRQRLQAVHDGVSSAPMGLRLDVSNGFEGVTPISFASGTMGQCNTTSTLTYGPNQTIPLAGSEDARIDFDFVTRVRMRAMLGNSGPT